MKKFLILYTVLVSSVFLVCDHVYAATPREYCNELSNITTSTALLRDHGDSLEQVLEWNAKGIDSLPARFRTTVALRMDKNIRDVFANPDYTPEKVNVTVYYNCMSEHWFDELNGAQ